MSGGGVGVGGGGPDNNNKNFRFFGMTKMKNYQHYLSELSKALKEHELCVWFISDL